MSIKQLLVLLLVALALLGARCEEEHAHEHEDHSHEHAHDDHAGHSHGVSQADYEAALARGEDPCAADGLLDYNLSLNIAAVFILLAVSLIGSLGPLALARLGGKAGGRTRSAISTAITLGSLFGCGTMLATALIHMALPAVAALTSPCLKAAGWDQYEAWPYLFILIAILVTQLVDALIRGYFVRRHPAPGAAQQDGGAHVPTGGCGHTMLIGAMTAPPSQAPHAHAHAKEDTAGHQHTKDAEAGEAGPEGGPCAVHGEGCSALLGHAPEPQRTSRTLGVWLADAGIIFHSVMIGLTLGVTGGTAFNTLLAALSFHQFFEGLALGSAAIQAGLATSKTVVVGLTYSVSTPIGTAIGIGIRESFNANATSTLLATGILDALSTGILLYVALVQLITPLLTDSAWLHSRRWPMQVVAFAAFYAGAAVMAVIGKWA